MTTVLIVNDATRVVNSIQQGPRGFIPRALAGLSAVEVDDASFADVFSDPSRSYKLVDGAVATEANPDFVPDDGLPEG